MTFDYNDNSSTGQNSNQPEEIFSIKKTPNIQKQTADNFKRRKYLPNKIKDKKTTSFQIGELPSMFKPYPEGSRVFADNYSYWDIKNYNDSVLPDDVTAEIILEGIHTEGFDKYELALADFKYIKFLRKLSYYPDFSCESVAYCHNCDAELKTFITVPSVNNPSKSVIDFYDIIAELPLRAKFKSFEGEHTFIPMTVGQYIDLVRNDKLYIKNKDGKFLFDNNGNKIIDKIAAISCLCSSMRYEDAYNKFSNVKEKVDIDTLDKIDEVLDCGIKPVETKCKKCEAINIIDLEEEDEIVLSPFREYDNSKEYGILTSLQ